VDPLEDERYAVIVLRLVLDQRGQILRGEIVSAEGIVVSRFAAWEGLTRSLLAWLESQR
jgi:hypothetical protein